MSGRGAILAIGLAVTLASGPGAGQTASPAGEPAVPPAAPAAASWSGSAALYLYLQEERNYLVPVLRADHGSLHLEGRYQYEAPETFSAWVGWNFETGESLHLAITPMVGGLVGQNE